MDQPTSIHTEATFEHQLHENTQLLSSSQIRKNIFTDWNCRIIYLILFSSADRSHDVKA